MTVAMRRDGVGMRSSKSSTRKLATQPSDGSASQAETGSRVGNPAIAMTTKGPPPEAVRQGPGDDAGAVSALVPTNRS